MSFRLSLDRLARGILSGGLCPVYVYMFGCVCEDVNAGDVVGAVTEGLAALLLFSSTLFQRTCNGRCDARGLITMRPYIP